MFFPACRCSCIQPYSKGMELVLQKRLMARRVRPDQRWEVGHVGVGAGGGQPGSNAREGRSLAVDQPSASRTFPGSEARQCTCWWPVACGGAAECGGGDPQDQPPPKSHIRRDFSETKLMSVPGVELVGKRHKGKALTSEPPRRQATSSGGRSEHGRQGGRLRRQERHENTKNENMHGGFCIISGRPRLAGSDYGNLPPSPIFDTHCPDIPT
jgi:hypothetical protein